MGLENARVENDGQKLWGLENAGLEYDVQTFSKLSTITGSGKCRTGK